MAYDAALASRVLDNVDRDRLDMGNFIDDDYVRRRVMAGREPQVGCNTEACLAGWTVLEKLRDPGTTDEDRRRIAKRIHEHGWSVTAAESLGVTAYTDEECDQYTPEMDHLSWIFTEMDDAYEAVSRFRQMFQPDPASPPT